MNKSECGASEVNEKVPAAVVMGQVFVRRSTAALLLLVAVLCIACVALLVLLLAPDWRDPGGHMTTGPQSNLAHVFGTASSQGHRNPPATQKPQPTTTQRLTTTPRPRPPIETPTTTTTEAHKEPWEREYRIPRSTIPIHYDLFLHPDLETGRFEGKNTITIGVTAPINYLVVHVKQMNVTKTVLKDGLTEELINVTDAFEYEPNEFWVVRPKDTLQPQNYSLYLEFEGSLDGSIVGLYRSSYTTKDGEKRSIATSKFQPTDARSAFPCFDEPSFKSSFTTTLVRPSEGYIALSNMPVEREIPNSPSQGLTEVIFQRSVPMVTYLACFIVCDFKYVEVLTQDNKPFRVYSTADQLSRTNYSRDLGVHVLNYFEDYFDVKYPLPKQDMIAIPDFISGAMEHWGLITYREVNLLYDDEGSSSFNKQRVASVVAHELAHMWFGNLVTLEWWDDLWLNEGFASYIEYKGVANYEKDWDMEGQFVIDDLQRVMVLDSQLSSHPIVQAVNHPDEITEIFDSISYSKGASVLRMLEDFLGPETFRAGVSSFLRKFKYDNAVTKDLWTELEKISKGNLNISNIMDTWTRQMGYPVLSVKRSSADSNKIELRQKRFLLDPTAESPDDSPYGYLWDIPVSYATSVSNKTQTWFWRNNDTLTIDKPAEASWIKFNVGQYGFYRVNYEPSMWQEIIDLLMSNHEALSPPDRSSLLDDAFNLAGADMLPYQTVLSLVAYMKKETHYIPWKTVVSHLGKTGRLLRKTKSYPYFRKYIVNLVKDHVERLGWNDTGSHLERRNRLDLMALACNNGYEPCLEGAYERLVKWIKDPEYFISPNTRSLVYKYGVQKAGFEEWETMKDRYTKEVNAQEKLKLAVGLSSSNEDWIVERWMMLAKNESIVRGQDYLTVLNNIASNPWSTHIVWSFVKANWQYLVDRFTLNNRYVGRMVKYVSTRFTSQYELEDLMDFFQKYPEAGSGVRARQQAIEEIQKNIAWIEKYEDTLHTWFMKNAGKL
ncbi:glutamyl aminopeptidase-like [Palaemon carinicauda]|uniref:glutamyl aminopeptidase-like n=1 Tax=Palaemon carinicauda TaxID=392227 RepID=UPI0035B5F9C9